MLRITQFNKKKKKIRERDYSFLMIFSLNTNLFSKLLHHVIILRNLQLKLHDWFDLFYVRAADFYLQQQITQTCVNKGGKKMPNMQHS